MMKEARKNREGLEAGAAAFLGEAVSPSPSNRLREYGLQRVFARADALAGEGARHAARHDYRNPALLRRVAVVIVALLLFMTASTAGAYALSNDAQPGSVLYGTKIFFERARIAFTTSAIGDARLEMDFSDRRMQELQHMVASGDEKGAERWLREYLRNLEGAGALLETTTGEGADELRQRYGDMLDNHAHTMEGMRHGQPSGLEQSIESAYGACENERMRMHRGHGQDGAASSPQAPQDGEQQESYTPMEGDSEGGEVPSVPADPQPAGEGEAEKDPPAPQEPNPAPDPAYPEGGQGPRGPGNGDSGMQE